jgi:hypothetical protein
MELSIKNEKLVAHFEAERNIASQNANQQAADSNAWVKEHPESILYNYLDSFLEVCEARGVEIDLTYATAKNIGPGLIALFSHQKKHYEHSKNVDIVAKTLAAVLSYLAINEHNCWFRTTSYLAQVKAGKTPKQPLWAGVFSIVVGRRNKYIDFLPCCKAAVIPGTILIPGGLTLHIDAVIAEYKKLTGVDLTEYGFANLFIN